MTILLLPGFMTDEQLWAGMAPYWTTSEPLEYADLSRGSSIEEMASMVLATAPAQFILVGFSMGGYVAREIVRIASWRVSKLVLIATSARGDKPGSLQKKKAALEAVKSAKFTGLSTASIRASLHPDNQDSDLIEQIRSMGNRLGRDVFARQASLLRQDGVHTLADIACPTLVIAADGDQLRGAEEVRELADRIPHAEFALIAHSGHMIPLEAPQALAQTISAWLSRQAAPTPGVNH
jgi:pimeloyl-ACP methyl ester carboxylesterase